MREGLGQNTKWYFFDVRDPNTKKYEDKILKQCHRTKEMEKKQKYNERIFLVENRSFTTLVFSINGGMGVNKCYSHIVKKLAEKRDEPYSLMIYVRGS